MSLYFRIYTLSAIACMQSATLGANGVYKISLSEEAVQ